VLAPVRGSIRGSPRAFTTSGSPRALIASGSPRSLTTSGCQFPLRARSNCTIPGQAPKVIHTKGLTWQPMSFRISTCRVLAYLSQLVEIKQLQTLWNQHLRVFASQALYIQHLHQNTGGGRGPARHSLAAPKSEACPLRRTKAGRSSLATSPCLFPESRRAEQYRAKMSGEKAASSRRTPHGGYEFATLTTRHSPFLTCRAEALAWRRALGASPDPNRDECLLRVPTWSERRVRPSQTCAGCVISIAPCFVRLVKANERFRPARARLVPSILGPGAPGNRTHRAFVRRVRRSSNRAAAN